MRILLDECVPRRFRRQLQGHEVRTLPEMVAHPENLRFKGRPQSSDPVFQLSDIINDKHEG